ncbi:head completion/stabilization protein [Laribacter hongkongensis]|uniref:head completion/stabilization protein n=1 Tax=Laribacter hongkongensis TaxID=168471 RepID=UPI001EFE9DD3|nr:head completion/stabilization protein [Laribacter hongkongensis]MCG9124305.1 head completion/stabilization protein [Laribacter hongkongensis]
MFVHPAPPGPTADQADGTAILANPFWPEIDPAHARATMRLDGTVTAARLRAALVEAIASVGSQLAGWRREQMAAGHASLSDVPDDTVDGDPVRVQRWKRAVLALATASLTERYRSFDSTAAGHRQADALDPAIDELRRDAAWAIAEIQGRARSTIELI